MANFSKYFPTLLKHEGGFVNDPADRGGATNLGVTLKVWVESGYDKDKDGDIDVNDLKLINGQDAEYIAKHLYWNPVAGDYIPSQSVAEFVFDWAYNSGVNRAIKYLQTCLGVVVDGKIGPQTLSKIKAADQKKLFDCLKQKRTEFIDAIIKNNPSQKKFEKGWKNRINSFTYKG